MTHSKKIALSFVGSAIVLIAVVTLVEIISPHDPIKAAKKAPYIIYGEYEANHDGTTVLMIREIWKAPKLNQSELSIGSFIPSFLPKEVRDSGQVPTGAVIFLQQNSNTLKATLPPSNLYAVYDSTVIATGQTLSEFKASCITHE